MCGVAVVKEKVREGERIVSCLPCLVYHPIPLELLRTDNG